MTLILVSFVPISIVSVTCIEHYAERELETQIDEKLLSHGQVIAKETLLWENQLSLALRNLTLQLNLSKMDIHKQKQILTTIAKLHPYTSFQIIDINGFPIISNLTEKKNKL